MSDEQPVVREIGNRTFIVAPVEPLDVDGVRTLAVGTVLWAIAFLMLVPFSGRLREDGHLWWMWTCVAGFGLGLSIAKAIVLAHGGMLSLHDRKPHGLNVRINLPCEQQGRRSAA